MHTGRLTDVAQIENSHSVATSCENGSVHVWRVDVAARKVSLAPTVSGSLPSSQTGISSNVSASSGSRSLLTVSGMSMIKTLDPSEGAVVCLQHFNGDSASILAYCTVQGSVRTWDLRCSNEPFVYKVPPEFGFPTAMTISPDRNWISVGTSKGCVALWDIRYNVMSRAWQHSSASPIHRLACCKSVNVSNSSSRDYPEGAYLFVAAGRGEAAVWGLPEGGPCIRCFRTLPPPPAGDSTAHAYHTLAPLPVLQEISTPKVRNIRHSEIKSRLHNDSNSFEPSVRAVIGRISSTGSSYVVTAGMDRYIRFWDFHSPAKCFTVSGMEPSQPKPFYGTPDVDGFRGNLFLCYDTALPSVEATLQAHLPARENRGLVQATVGYKVCVNFMSFLYYLNCFHPAEWNNGLKSN
jgi:phosphoinositide-3-kinase regulatory subunit 4